MHIPARPVVQQTSTTCLYHISSHQLSSRWHSLDPLCLDCRAYRTPLICKGICRESDDELDPRLPGEHPHSPNENTWGFFPVALEELDDTSGGSRIV